MHEATLQKPGIGVLAFERDGRHTILRRRYATSPLKFLTPEHSGDASWVYLSSYGGGLVGGDSIDLDIRVARSARGVIATQASTKVYRSTSEAKQQLYARVESEGSLYLLPDPVVGFAGSQFAQRQRIELAPRASLLLLDWLTAGRVASGERWQMRAYQSRIEIVRDDRLLFHDALRLTPEDGDLAHRMRRFNVLLTAVLAGPELAAAAAEIHAAIGASPLRHAPDILVSTSGIADDVLIIRAASVSTERMTNWLRATLSFLHAVLGDDPWRK